MILTKLIQFCSEELQRTGRALASAYATLRELDQMTLATVLMFFRDR